jgi:ParB family chromosome partitioning protein
VTSIEVNQPEASAPVAPHRVEPMRRPDSGISLDAPRENVQQAPAPASSWPDEIESMTNEAALVPEASEPETPPATEDGTDMLLHVDVHLIETNPFQPRKHFSEAEIDQLSRSIQEHGLLQPLLVRRTDESYQLIAGERRLRAAQAAGWREVPVKVVEAEERQMSELALVENLQRKDLNAMEKAASFKQYLETTGCTQEELAGRLKLDRSTIANLVRLLELPDAVQEAVRQGKISQGHARALLPLGDEPQQVAFTERIQHEGMSVRATERAVQETIDAEDHEPLAVVGRDGNSRRTKPQNEQIAALEQEFRAGLGTKVKLTASARGRGKLVIQFNNHAEFERIRQHILGPEAPAIERAG